MTNVGFQHCIGNVQFLANPLIKAFVGAVWDEFILPGKATRNDFPKGKQQEMSQILRGQHSMCWGGEIISPRTTENSPKEMGPQLFQGNPTVSEIL